MFNESKYTKWYYAIISKANTENRKKGPGLYYERHHIIPKCKPFNGSNSKDNLVLLTSKEHFVCHVLLTKMCEGEFRYKMLAAMHRFKHGNDNSYFSSRIYESLKRQYQVEKSNRMKGEGNPFYGKTHSIEWRKKHSAFLSHNTKGEMNSFFGKTHSNEAKILISNARKSQDKIACVHCKTETDITNHKQFHGDNCFHNPNANIDVITKRRKLAKERSDKAAAKTACKNCGGLYSSGMLKRWHNDNCKISRSL